MCAKQLKIDNGFVFFWQLEEENEELTNFFESYFVVEGIGYSCVEQYMMSKKALMFGDTETYAKIMESTEPDEIKAFGRKVKNFDSDDWDISKWKIVYNGNFAKFTQNPLLRDKLLATGDAILAEASPHDKIWGIGVDRSDPLAQKPECWEGENLLGQILQEIRDELRTGKLSKSRFRGSMKLDETDKEILRKVDRDRLLKLISELKEVDNIEWGGGPTGKKNEFGGEIIQWPFPKYPGCVFDALEIVGRAGGTGNGIVPPRTPYDLDPYEIKSYFSSLRREERFCDGLIASAARNGRILACLERLLELLDSVTGDSSL